MNVRVKKGDNVTILAGKDRGKTGKVMRVIPKEDRVVVEGVNVVKKHKRPTRSVPQGGIMNVPAPVAISRVMVVCPQCQKPTRVAVTIDSAGKRLRTCKKCKETWAA